MHSTNLFLSHWNDEKKVYVPEDIVKDLKTCHFDSIRFLYNCYKKGLRGAILNQDVDMNFQIQASAFLKAISSDVNNKILVLASQMTILAWHYHLSKHAGLTVKLITPENIDDLNNEQVILAPVKDLKSLQCLTDLDFFITIIEDFDEVVKHLIVKKLRGEFNIGYTCRNFLLNPDLKLWWKMLHWCNPDVIGKMNQFFEDGFDSEYNLSHPYCDFWLRITWNFSETFKKDSPDEKQEYLIKLQTWAETCDLNLQNVVVKKVRSQSSISRKGKKRNFQGEAKIKEELSEGKSEDSSNDINIPDRCVKKIESNAKVSKKETKTSRSKAKVMKEDLKVEFNQDSSQETIISDNERNLKISEKETKISPNEAEVKKEDIRVEFDQDSSQDTIISDNDYSEYNQYVQLPSMDENPILTSIVKNFECPSIKSESIVKSTENASCSDNTVLSCLFDRPSTSKCHETFTNSDSKPNEDSDNDILNSLLG